jgi:hypothetical protein
MKKQFVVIFALTFFLCGTFCFGDFIEQKDYRIVYQGKPQGMLDVLHIIMNTIPKPREAEEILIRQLIKYGTMLTINSGDEARYKNIIGSVWFYNENLSKFEKIKFHKYLAAYVWIGKIRNVVPFPKYILFLKKSGNTNAKKQQTHNETTINNSMI